MKCLLTGFFVLAAATLVRADTTTVTSIPWSQLGAEVQKRADGNGSHVTCTACGAKLKAEMQDLEGEVTTEGLWITSTAEEHAEKSVRFRILASGMSRQGSSDGERSLPSSGVVRAARNGAALIRRGLVEEYSVSTDGVRQDFVILGRPTGMGSLRVNLDVSGAVAETCAYGVKLTLHACRREIAYSRLRVTDANGKDLEATMEAASADRLVVSVKDADAVYPIRIDPTFSDADWVSLNPIPGTYGEVRALAVDGAGNLYVGGTFTSIGNLAAKSIAKWNGSTWTSLATGVGFPSFSFTGTVYDMVIKDNDLYVCGEFGEAGGLIANNIAKWNGSTWTALGDGIDSSVYALASSGEELLAGTSGGVYQWNGSSWSPLGTGVNGEVYALVASGGIVYAGGTFTEAGGVAANHIAQWNGNSWSSLGSGMAGSSVPGESAVYALTVMEGDLYAGGDFTSAGGVNAKSIAKWNGITWSTLGSGINEGSSQVFALTAHGNELFVGGLFNLAGGIPANGIAKWNSSGWTPLGSGVGGNGQHVFEIAFGGSDLYAGGFYTTAGGSPANSIAMWNGSAWSSLGSPGFNGAVHAVASSGSDLYVGGEFTTAGGVAANHIAKWNGSVWSALGSGTNGTVHALAIKEGHVYAGGAFTEAGGDGWVAGIAEWDGNNWSRLGGAIGLSSGNRSAGMVAVYALAFSGPDLYVGGRFDYVEGSPAPSIAKWNGAAWSAFGGQLPIVYSLAVNGSDLYAGGGVLDHPQNGGIWKWDGSTWSTPGSGLNGTVYALAMKDTDLFAGGVFVGGIAKWNGSSWSQLGSGVHGEVRSIAVRGNEVYAGGLIDTAGGFPVGNIAKWDGGAWSGIGSGTSYEVRALAAGSRDHLFVGGMFNHAGAIPSPFIAQVNLPQIASPLPDWRQVHFGSSLNAGDAADTFDYDGDGQANLMEWALGMNPSTTDAPVTQTVLNGNSIEYSYSRSVGAVYAGAIFNVEWSDSLPGTAWSTAGVIQTVLSDNGTTQQVKANLPAGTNGKRFVRLKVTAAE